MKSFDYNKEAESIGKTVATLTDEDISFLCFKNKLVMMDSIMFSEDLRIIRELINLKAQ
jgi:hypothetical protein